MSDLSDQSELAEFDFDGTAIQNAGDDGWTQTRGDYQFGFRGDVRQSIRGETKFTLQATIFVTHNGDDVLVLEDYLGDIDFTQFDIY